MKSGDRVDIISFRNQTGSNRTGNTANVFKNGKLPNLILIIGAIIAQPNQSPKKIELVQDPGSFEK
jgi:hypothetical protein